MNLPKRFLTVSLVVALAFGFAFSSDAVAAQNPVLVLADVSGTMRDSMAIDPAAGIGEDGKVVKSVAMKELLLRLSGEMSSLPCQFGIYEVRYIGGNKARYRQLLPLGKYEESAVTSKIRNDFKTDFPVFNRRTPLADALRQLDENELQGMGGRITVVYVSDGCETYYDLEDDLAASQGAGASDADGVRGLVTETKRLKEKYGNEFAVFAVHLGQEDEGSAESMERLKQAAAMGGGGFYAGRQLLESGDSLTGFAEGICQAPEPEPTVAPPAPFVPAGTPEEPLSLQNIYFEFDKSRITPEAEAVLKNNAKWMMENPSAMVTVEGHCDERGTDEYNMALGERRAQSAKQYLIRLGIDPARFVTVSYGEEKPADPRHNEEAWAKNRRAVFVPGTM